MSKDTLFHDFFHNPEARGEYVGCSRSFQGDKFFSYYTVIGQKFYKKAGGDPYLIISSNSMSRTTGKQISALRHACPYSIERILYAPFTCGDHYGYTVPSIQTLFENRIKIALNGIEACERKENRWEAQQLLINYEKFRKTFKVKKFRPALNLAKAIGEIEVKRAKPVDPVKAEKNRIARAAKLVRDLARVKDWTYLEKVRFCFKRQLKSPFNAKTTQELRRSISESVYHVFDGSRPSFMWREGDDVVTSQNVHIPVLIVRRAMDAWRKNGIESVHTVGRYNLDKATADYMKVGCHYIPMENIIALEKELSAI
jgi:hypothetical protein